MTDRRQSMPLMPGLDGLRAFAVLAVFLFHSQPGLLPGGWVGVDVFFVLSGFLITGQLVRERSNTGRIALGQFWGRRIARLYPALLVALVLVAAVTPAAGFGWKRYVLDAVSSLTYWFNFEAAFIKTPSLVGHFWSLSVEEQFYLLWPLVIIYAARRRSSLQSLCLIGAGVFALGKVVTLLAGVDAGTLYFLPLGHGDELLLGSAVAIAWRDDAWRPLWEVGRRPVTAVSAAALLVVAAVAIDGFTPRWLYYGGVTGIAICSVVLVVHVACGESPVTRLLSWQPLRALGARSYGFYLFHQPIILALKAHGMHLRVVLPVAFILTLAITWLSFALVEDPVREWGRRRFRAVPAPVTA